MGYRNEERRKVNVLEMKCLSPDKGEMPSSDVDGVNYKVDATTDIKAEVPSICAKGCWITAHA